MGNPFKRKKDYSSETSSYDTETSYDTTTPHDSWSPSRMGFIHYEFKPTEKRNKEKNIRKDFKSHGYKVNNIIHSQDGKTKKNNESTRNQRILATNKSGEKFHFIKMRKDETAFIALALNNFNRTFNTSLSPKSFVTKIGDDIYFASKDISNLKCYNEYERKTLKPLVSGAILASYIRMVHREYDLNTGNIKFEKDLKTGEWHARSIDFDGSVFTHNYGSRIRRKATEKGFDSDITTDDLDFYDNEPRYVQKLNKYIEKKTSWQYGIFCSKEIGDLNHKDFDLEQLIALHKIICFPSRLIGEIFDHHFPQELQHRRDECVAEIEDSLKRFKEIAKEHIELITEDLKQDREGRKTLKEFREFRHKNPKGRLQEKFARNCSTALHESGEMTKADFNSLKNEYGKTFAKEQKKPFSTAHTSFDEYDDCRKGFNRGSREHGHERAHKRHKPNGRYDDYYDAPRPSPNVYSRGVHEARSHHVPRTTF